MRKQRGVALITALLVLAIATVAAVEIASRQHMDIRRTQNILARDQAFDYLMSAESWVLTSLKSDLMGGDQVDGFHEGWAKPISVPAFEGATLQGQVEDLQGRFNLNNLADLPVEFQARTSNIHYQRFKALLEVVGQLHPELELQPDKIELLVDTLADWIDSDLTPRARGAEDDLYLRQDQPYRTANRWLTHASELRLIQGFRPEDSPGLVDALEPLVVALPAGTSINVNTAKPEVLMALSPRISEQAAQDLIKRATTQPWTSTSDFVSQLKSFGVQNLAVDGLSTNTHYFAFSGTVSLGPAEGRLYSVIHRGQDTSLSVISRSRSTL